MKTIQKTISFLTKQERKRGLLVLFLVLGMALLETAGVASVMPFLAVLGNPEIVNTNPILNTLNTYAQDFGIITQDNFIIALGIGSFIIIITSAVYRTFTNYAVNSYIEVRRHSIGERLLESYLSQPYTFFLDRHSSEMSKAILSEVDQLVSNVFRPIYNMISYSLVLISITILLLVVNPLLALLAAGILGGLYLLVFIILKHKLTHLGSVRVVTNKERFMAASEAFGGIKDIKLLGHEHSYLSRFTSPSLRYAITQAKYQTLNQVPNFLIEAIVFGTILLLTVIMMISSGGLSSGALGEILPTLGLYTFSAYRMKPAVQFIYRGFAGIRYGKAAVDSIYADLHSNNIKKTLHTIDSSSIKVCHSIALQHLGYTYPNTNKYTLNNLNLEIPIGSSIGLVGSTGAGKTTLVDIILGLLRPTQGVITVDSEPLNDSQVRAWQKSLGYVPQEIFLTDSSIAENIAFGIPKAQINQVQVERCARMAQVHDFVLQELPMQYNTLIGERGVRLSGGERQRIGIARALYRNPEILVFDEATSALDTLTEQAVMDAIDVLSQQKTIIIIAHRLSTVKNCDQIALLEQGKIIATGNYKELIETNLQFKEMSRRS